MSRQSSNGDYPEPVDDTSSNVGDSYGAVTTLGRLTRHYEEQLARKEEVIQQLTAAMSMLNVASPRRIDPGIERCSLEKAFIDTPQEMHALKSLFDPSDWQSGLDGVTQLTMSLLMHLSGIELLSLKRLDGRNAVYIEYKVSCGVSSTSLRVNTRVPWSFAFDLLFRFEEMEAVADRSSESEHPRILITYLPVSLDDPSHVFVGRLGVYSYPTSFSFEELFARFVDLAHVLKDASLHF
ncbi:hypothetical protein VNI00_011529 [Paramarasmius palmivorus]|uniref:Uncharacterized protein n=1 Tax=Paramarasmius palmivorus TaxID=297713 RepID=A0AAW0CDL1_9AGAR